MTRSIAFSSWIALLAALITVEATRAQGLDPRLAERYGLLVRDAAEQQAPELPIEEADAAPDSPEGAQPEHSAEEKRLQELKALSFDRSPAGALGAWARLQQEGAALTNDVLRFKLQVEAGNWKAAGDFIKTLPEAHQGQVYEAMLRKLLQPPESQGPQRPGPASPGGDVLVKVEDALLLARHAPGTVNQEQVELLGKILGKALQSGAYSAPVVSLLNQKDWAPSRTEDERRKLAAKLLIAADRLIEAGEFLPNIEVDLGEPTAMSMEDLDIRARYWLAKGNKENSDHDLKIAWRANLAILEKAKQQAETPGAESDSQTKERQRLTRTALSRALALFEKMKEGLAQEWLRASFRDNPTDGAALFAAIHEEFSKARKGKQAGLRIRALERQKLLADQLLAVMGEGSTDWVLPLHVLAMNWLQEAEWTRDNYAEEGRYRQSHDPFGNPIYSQPYRPRNPNELQPIQPDQLLLTAPSERWILQLERPFRPRLHELSAEMHFKVGEESKSLPRLEQVAQVDLERAAALADRLLRSWAETHSPEKRNRHMQPRYYGFPGRRSPQGIPLPRAIQKRNLTELAGILDRLEPLKLSLDEQAVVAAFTASHSAAEVYRTEDIIKVFGPLEAIDSQVLSQLLQSMRSSLAGQWRRPQVQQAAGTRRRDKEIEKEVTRGYAVISQLLDQALSKDPDDWRLAQVQAATTYDWAEFDYGRKVDLAIYTEKRDRAFALFSQAAELYAEGIANRDRKDESAEVYLQWFNANLGASDLSYLTRQTDPSADRLEKIRQAILSLPEGSAERHLELFAKALSSSTGRLAAELKPRYLRAGLRIVQDHEAASEARTLVEFYDGLTDEIRLHVAVDGESTVGHGHPFGVFVSLRYTEAVGREAGGFAKYLQNQPGYTYYYNPGMSRSDHRDEFEKQVREKWSDGLEVLSVTFHDAKVEPRGYGKDDWRETPLAYVLLKAKDGSTDRLPPLQLDMDFADASGQVILPIESLPLIIDARPKSVPPRPVGELAVLQILDDRDWREGVVTVEINATGQGLVPDLESLLDPHWPGFQVTEIEEQDLAVTEFVSDEKLAAKSERHWMVRLAALEGGGGESFEFAPIQMPIATPTYKRYADADLVEVERQVVLAGIGAAGRHWWKWMLAFAMVGAAAASLVFFRRSTPLAAGPVGSYRVPESVTPFSVLALLRRIHGDPALSFSADEKEDLKRTIRRVESHHFAPKEKTKRKEGDDLPALESIAHDWVTAALDGTRRNGKTGSAL